VLDNPFALIPYRTRDGRTVMASAVYPHQAANWCRFLNVPPDFTKVAAAFSNWDAFGLEEAANAAGLPACVARSAEEWLAHPHGSLLLVIRRLSAEHPGVAVLDTRVVLRSAKSWGRLLGLDGRAQDVVPVDLWASV
jgi:crotonobetainyl-CoA:carnitine CoA-transferase CaiB-like acyl-CoA transferase